MSEEKTNRTQSAKPPKRKRHIVRNIFKVIGTLFLVGILTAAIFVGIFMRYVDKTMRDKIEVDLKGYRLSVSTELYYKDPDTEQWVKYQNLFSDENRILVSSDQIPDNLKKATVAIEDKRFESHKGVDLRGTARAILSTLTGQGVQGGSTITQQLVKNVTGDNQNTVKRKVQEIYRALKLDAAYDKDEILVAYLNAVFFGNQCNGVQTASNFYFNKNVSDLTLAECASLISITNNPSRYDPTRADWSREANRSRQLLVLNAMLEQGMISQAVHDEAVAEDVVFSDGWTILGNYVGPQETEETEEKETKLGRNSYFTDQVISDVARDLVTYYGWENTTENYEKAIGLVYNGGYKIYTTMNPKIQEIAENVFVNTKYLNTKDMYGQPLQAAITIMDPYTADVVGLVGGTGTKVGDRVWNWATEPRQCGSAIKPLSCYAPALDNGTINMNTVLDDYPVMVLGSHGVWPATSHASYEGLVTVRTALVQSLNPPAVRVNMAYGTYESYLYLRDKLGFTTLTEEDSTAAGNMALGGFNVGVTTEEMCAAYCSFVNDGIYTPPRTYSEVQDENGQTIIKNEPASTVAMKEQTAYLIRETLKGVMSEGTGTAARFSGMEMAGKTGTTNDNRDRYFVGFTPYYCAAVWCGYKSNVKLNVSGNPSSVLWHDVMQEIHKELDKASFHNCSTGLTKVSVCMDCGNLAQGCCSNTLRGNRVQTVTVISEYAPKEQCTCHVAVDYCSEGKCLATDKCPKGSVSSVLVCNYDRPILSKGGSVYSVKADDDYYIYNRLEAAAATKADDGSVGCPAHVHREPVPEDPDEPSQETSNLLQAIAGFFHPKE